LGEGAVLGGADIDGRGCGTVRQVGYINLRPDGAAVTVGSAADLSPVLNPLFVVMRREPQS
jgi:hypothetical protein